MFKKKKTVEKPNRKRIKYIASVETTRNHWREDFSFGRDGHSLSSSGRWTDAIAERRVRCKVLARIAFRFHDRAYLLGTVFRIHLVQDIP